VGSRDCEFFNKVAQDGDEIVHIPNADRVGSATMH
jgi:hypothetical protein